MAGFFFAQDSDQRPQSRRAMRLTGLLPADVAAGLWGGGTGGCCGEMRYKGDGGGKRGLHGLDEFGC